MAISVLDFGAKPNSKEVQTKCFQDALDYCFNNGGGEVIVPEGEYIIGSIQIKSNTTFHLLENAKLLGSRDMADYPIFLDIDPEKFMPDVNYDGRREYTRNWHRGLINIYHSDNIAIIGDKNSIIDGRNVFNPDGEENYRGPHLLSAIHCENLLLKGYTAQNSSNWCHCTFFIKNAVVDDVTIIAGHDGLDFFGSDNIEVKNCHIYSGDDCVAGYDNRNVVVRDCLLNTSCNIFRFSGKNVLIENCEVIGPGKYIHRYSLTQEQKINGDNIEPKDYAYYRNNMENFFLYYADHRMNVRDIPSNILVRNCTVTNCDRFFSYTFHETVRWQCGAPMGQIAFENIKIDGVKDSIKALADPKVPFELSVKDCEITFKDPTVPFFKAGNFSKLTFENIKTNNNQAPLGIEYGNAGEVIIKGGDLKEDGEILSRPYEEFIMPPH